MTSHDEERGAATGRREERRRVLQAGFFAIVSAAMLSPHSAFAATENVTIDNFTFAPA